MTPPVLPQGSTSAIGAASTAGMRHTARQVFPGSTRQVNGEYSTAPSYGPPTCAHLKSIGSTLAEIAASKGLEAQWSLKVPSAVPIPAGSIWEVAGDEWTEVVKVTGDLVKHGRVMRLVAAVDTQLNR